MTQIELHQKMTRLLVATNYLNQNAIEFSNGEITFDEYTNKQRQTWLQVCDALNSLEEIEE